MTTKENITNELNGMTKYWRENLQVTGHDLSLIHI